MGGSSSKTTAPPSPHSREIKPLAPPRTLCVEEKLRAADPAAYGRWEPRPEGGLGRVVNVYDGDTLTVLCSLAGELWKCNVRVKGVDCPEMRGRGADEKAAATAVRDLVRHRCDGEVCGLKTHGTDKYGRMIAEISMPGGEDLATFLLGHGLARAYAGDTRKPFSEDEISQIIRTCTNLVEGAGAQGGTSLNEGA